MGLLAGVLGGLAAVGGVIAVAASSGGKKPAPRLGGVRRTLPAKKPCGCGR